MGSFNKILKCLNRKTYKGRGRPRNSDYYFVTFGELMREYAKAFRRYMMEEAQAERGLLNNIQ